MKYVTSILLIPLLVISTAYPLDLHTDSTCAHLKELITHANPMEQVQNTWTSVCSTSNLTPADTKALADQAKQYALEVKQALVHELAALGDPEYHTSMVATGTLKAVFGLWGISWIVGFIIHQTCSSKIVNVAHKITVFDGALLKNMKNKLITNLTLFFFSIPVRIIAPWLLYHGIKQIRAGLSSKQTLKQKINNLDTIITFFDQMPLISTSTGQSQPSDTSSI